MPFAPDLLTKLKSLAAVPGAFFRKTAEKLSRVGIVIKLQVLVENTLDKLLMYIPAEKRRLVLTGIGGALGIVLLLVVLIMVWLRNPSSKDPPAAVLSRPVSIPVEELFLPDEPDFIPGVLLEREQRGVWTPEDAAPFWQDPLKNGEEQWRAMIEKTVDALLESVP
jgi:hypothetical protein